MDSLGFLSLEEQAHKRQIPAAHRRGLSGVPKGTHLTQHMALVTDGAAIAGALWEFALSVLTVM